MDAIYKADPGRTPYVTEKHLIKDLMSKCSQEAKMFEANMLEVGESLGSSVLELDTFLESLDYSDGEYPPVEEVNTKFCKQKPISFSRTDFKSEASLKVATDFASVNHAMKNFLEDKANLEECGRSGQRGRIKSRHLKYLGVKWIEDGRGDENAAAEELPDLVSWVDYSISVRVYHPFRHILGSKSSERPKLCQEIVILGNQTLAELRDMILCSADMGVPKDVSLDPFAPVTVRAWDVYKSGFVFINNTFYNDFRCPSNIDYSAVIRDWAEKRGIGPFETSTIETKMADLTVQFGYPYVYQHQGDCEHLIVFSEIKLLGKDDSLVSKYYPYVRTIPMQRARYCMVCGKNMATWITKDSTRVPVNPCYFCDKCFHMFNYVDGKKVGEFKAYPYVDRTALV